MSLLKFMLEISHALLQCGKVPTPKKGRPLSNTPPSKKSRTFTPRPTNVVRYDETGHWPIRVVEKQRYDRTMIVLIAEAAGQHRAWR
ncbi:hypothetical protein QTP88_023110 [Uroleucon formosanum]